MAYPHLYRAYYNGSLTEKGQSASGQSGIIAAGTTAGTRLWTYRYPETAVMPGASKLSKRLHVQRITWTVTTITAFGTPVTAGRRLSVSRGAPTSGTAADPTGGSSFTSVLHRSDQTGLETKGLLRCGTTAGVTVTGFTFEAPAIRRLSLTGSGAAGAVASAVWQFDGLNGDPIFLLPGELLAGTPVNDLDATGTIEFIVEIDACEVP